MKLSLCVPRCTYEDACKCQLVFTCVTSSLPPTRACMYHKFSPSYMCMHVRIRGCMQVFWHGWVQRRSSVWLLLAGVCLGVCCRLWPPLLHASAHASTHTHTHTHIHIHIHIHMHMHMHTHTYTHTCTSTCTHTYTYMHTHSRETSTSS